MVLALSLKPQVLVAIKETMEVDLTSRKSLYFANDVVKLFHEGINLFLSAKMCIEN